MEDRKFWMVALPIVWAANIAGAVYAAWLWFCC